MDAELKIDWRRAQRVLRDVDAQLAREARHWIVDAVNDTGVVQEARGAFPQVSGRGAASIRAVATARGAAIQAGGRSAAWVPWVEFGGTHPAGPDHHPAHRPYVRTGRYISPAVERRREAVRSAVEARMVQALDKISE